MSKVCTVVGCSKIVFCKNMCQSHYYKLRRYGDALAGKLRAANGDGTLINGGYKAVGHKMVHVEKAEKAIGKSLPSKAQVHHIDYDKENNSNDNLVICPNDSYHKLLHARTDAYNACGNANHRKCVICKQYDDPANMYNNHGSYTHKTCRNAQQRALYKHTNLKP